MMMVLMIMTMIVIMVMLMICLQGVGSVNLDKVDFIVKDEFSIPCSTFKQPAESKSFVHSSQSAGFVASVSSTTLLLS